MSRPCTSGGAGTIAIQPAKPLGASLATTASATKTDLVNNLGADVVIDTVGGENPRQVTAGAEAGRDRHQHHQATPPQLRPGGQRQSRRPAGRGRPELPDPPTLPDDTR